MSTLPHIADAEVSFKVVNIAPDFCDVEGQCVPFDISRDLSPEKSAYAQTVYARGERVLMIGSVVRGVVGNAGKGVISGVSTGAGDVIMATGSGVVLVEGRAVVRHDDLVRMNVAT